MRIQGLLFDGQSSRARPATVYRLGQHVILEYEGQSKSFERELVQVSSRLGSAPRAIEFPGLMRFESSDHESIDRAFGSQSSFIHKLENNTQLLILSLVAVAVFCVVSYLWIIPASSRWIVHQIPQSYLDDLAKKMEGDWGIGAKVTLSVEKQDRLDTVTTRLTQSFPNQRISIRPIDLGGAPNAFALPDGSMMVTEPLLDLLTTDQTLAVMMHEMGHVTHRHGLQNLAGQMILSVLMFFTIGAGDVTVLGQNLIGLSYSRRHETEADLFAAQHLKAIGLKPSLLAEGLKKIERSHSRRDREAGKVPGFLSSHPLTEERVKYLKALD